MSCIIYISILGFPAQPQRWAAELPKHYQTLLDEKTKLVENLDKKLVMKTKEEGQSKEDVEIKKKERIREIEQKFEEVVDMLAQGYSAHM